MSKLLLLREGWNGHSEQEAWFAVCAGEEVVQTGVRLLLIYRAPGFNLCAEAIA